MTGLFPLAPAQEHWRSYLKGTGQPEPLPPHLPPLQSIFLKQ